MTDVTQYRNVASWLHETTKTFMESFKWVQDLTPEQMASHKVTQQLNVDCHNGFLSNIIQKMGKADTYRLQHKEYYSISNDVDRDTDNRKSNSEVPVGVILRALSPKEHDDRPFNPIGRLSNEVRGTLFFKENKNSKLKNICVGDKKEFDFHHPFWWAVPTVDQILTVMSFAKKESLETILKVYEQETNPSVKTAVQKGVSEFIAKTKKPKCEKPEEQKTVSFDLAINQALIQQWASMQYQINDLSNISTGSTW